MSEILEKLSGKNINFLIGSGASYPIYETLSLGKNIISFEDLISSDGLSEDNRKLMYYYYYVNWIEKMYQIPNVSNDENNTAVLNNYYELINIILNILDTNGSEKPKRANIFTTNYDLLFEHTFEEILKERQNCYFNDGSIGFKDKILSPQSYNLSVSEMGYYDGYKREVPTINLFKIHGSVSWKNKDSKIYVSYDNKDNKIDVIEGFDIKDIKKTILKLTDKESIHKFNEELSNNLIFETYYYTKKIDSFYENYKKLAIINPNKWKFHETVFDQHYYQLIRNFSYELEKKDTVLIVFAFSFADEHIEEIFKRSLGNPSLEVIIICYSENDKNNLKEKFKNFNNIAYFPEKFDNKDNLVINGNFTYLNDFLNGGFDNE